MAMHDLEGPRSMGFWDVVTSAKQATVAWDVEPRGWFVAAGLPVAG